MATAQEVKSNIKKLLDMGAPEEDIDQYVSEEGFTPEEIRSISLTEEGGMLTATPKQLQERESRKFREALGKIGETVFPVLGKIANVQKGNVPLSTRLGESLKITPEGKSGFLRSQHPDILATQSPLSGVAEGQRISGVRGDNKRISVYDKDVGEYLPLNKPGFDVGDIAGLGGTAVQVAPNIAAGMTPYGQNPLVQGGAGMAGEGLLQFISSQLPGQENLTTTERASRIGSRGLLDTILTAGINQGYKAVDFLRPNNIVSRRYIKSQASNIDDIAKEGSRLSTEMERVGGRGLSLGRETLDPELIKMENAALQSTKGQLLGKQQYNSEIKSLVSHIDDTMSRIEKSGTPSFTSSKGEALGASLENSFRNLTGRLRSARNDNWNKLIGNAEKISGNNPVLLPDTLYAQVKETIAREGSPFYTGEAAKVLRNAGLLKKGLNGEFTVFDSTAPLTIRQIKNLEKSLTAIKGKQSYQVAKEWKKALMSDIDNAQFASPNTPSAKALEVLKEARARYSIDSTNIDNVVYSTIGRAAKINSPLSKIDAIPEEIADKILSNKFKPSELSYLSKVLKNEPDLWNKVRRYTLEKPYQEAIDSAVRSGPPGLAIKFDPKKYMDGYMGQEKFDLLFPKGDPIRQAVLDGIEIARRLGEPVRQVGASAHAPSQQASEIFGILGGIGSGHAASAGIFGPRYAAKYMTGPILAKVMLDPKNAKIVRTIKTTKPGTIQFTRASALFIEALIREAPEHDVAKSLQEGNQ